MTKEFLEKMTTEEVLAKINELDADVNLYKSMYNAMSDKVAHLQSKLDAITAICKL